MAETEEEEEKKGGFSVAVIGLGLIGSAACRHLSTHLGSSVLGLGPSDQDHDHDIPQQVKPFSSHFDQARLTRVVDPDPVWSLLAARSIARYADLQQQSNITFHHPIGSLRVSPALDGPGDTLRQAFCTGQQHGAVAELFEACRQSPLEKNFPYLHFKDGDSAIMEDGGAGYIDPRALIRAQLTYAERNGACIVGETVSGIIPSCSKGVEICTTAGQIYRASRVLVCAGSYSSFLLPEKTLDLRTEAVSIVLAEVDPCDQQRLQGMPSFIWKLKSHPFFHSVYGCPPVAYPSGKICLKIGGTAWRPRYLHSPEQISDWFHSDGDPHETGALLDVLNDLLINLHVVSTSTKPCMVSYTKHGYPYIDAVDAKPSGASSSIFVAAGGCGASAKSSDEIGRIAARLVASGHWDYDLDASIFRAEFTDGSTCQAKL